MNTDPELQGTAAERLALSRERIRQTMRASMPPPAAMRPVGEPPSWLAGVANIPVVAAVMDAVRSWWAHHPARVATLVASDAGRTFIRPMAERHPIGLVVGALLVGGLIAWARPWRGLVKPALFALLPQIVSKVVAHVPVESWMSVLSSFTSARSSRREDKASDQAQPAAAEPAQAAAPVSTPVNPPASSPASTTPTATAVVHTDPPGSTLH